jgi:hypothetical protein
MPSRFDPDESPAEQIDVDHRYDIYVAETPQRIVVYRNACFRSVKSLVRRGRYDLTSDFVEIELANGDIVYVRRYHVAKFCAPGTKLAEEVITPP